MNDVMDNYLLQEVLQTVVGFGGCVLKFADQPIDLVDH